MKDTMIDEASVEYGSDHTMSHALAAKIAIEAMLKRKPSQVL